VAQGHDVAAFCLARRFSGLLRLLQFGVGSLVRFYFVDQKVRLSLCFLLRNIAAILREHEQPGCYSRNDG
jgi:hypothetical protein